MTALFSLKVVHQNGMVAIFVGIGIVLLTGIGILIFGRAYFVCPICGRHVPSIGTTEGVALGSRCKRCDVDFSA